MNSAIGVVIVAAIWFHVVLGIALGTVTEVVESVRDYVYRHWLWQSSG